MKEIIQKNGKYWKECDIVMLPTKGELHFIRNGSSLSPGINMCRFNGIVKGIEEFYPGNKQPNPSFNTLSLCGIEDKNANGYSEYMWQPQHLYLLSNEQINEGDYFIWKEKICKASVNTNSDSVWSKDFPEGVYSYVQKDCKKIVASTDSSLTVEMIGSQILDRNKSCEDYGFKSGVGLLSHVRVESLPKLPEDFIKKYVESNGKMDKILVEYEGIESIIEQRINTIHTFEYKIKLNPDNTINILIKDSIEEAAKEYIGELILPIQFKDKKRYISQQQQMEAFKAGAKWQKNQLNN